MSKSVPVRKRRAWDERTREKIRAGYYINRLHEYIEGKIVLSIGQIRAIDILLKKCVPDLTRTEVKADMTYRYVAELPPVLSREEWERQYGPNQILQ